MKRTSIISELTSWLIPNGLVIDDLGYIYSQFYKVDSLGILKFDKNLVLLKRKTLPGVTYYNQYASYHFLNIYNNSLYIPSFGPITDFNSDETDVNIRPAVIYKMSLDHSFEHDSCSNIPFYVEDGLKVFDIYYLELNLSYFDPNYTWIDVTTAFAQSDNLAPNTIKTITANFDMLFQRYKVAPSDCSYPVATFPQYPDFICTAPTCTLAIDPITENC